jgi:hypothetical protein
MKVTPAEPELRSSARRVAIGHRLAHAAVRMTESHDPSSSPPSALEVLDAVSHAVRHAMQKVLASVDHARRIRGRPQAVALLGVEEGAREVEAALREGGDCLRPYTASSLERVPVRDLVRAVEREVSPRATQRRVRLELPGHEDGDLALRLDLEPVRRAVARLVEVAVSDASPGSTVRLTARRHDARFVELTVHDGEETCRVVRSRLLPSELARRVVEAHGGALRVDPGPPCAVRLLLPGPR